MRPDSILQELNQMVCIPFKPFIVSVMVFWVAQYVIVIMSVVHWSFWGFCVMIESFAVRGIQSPSQQRQFVIKVSVFRQHSSFKTFLPTSNYFRASLLLLCRFYRPCVCFMGMSRWNCDKKGVRQEYNVWVRFALFLILTVINTIFQSYIVYYKNEL